MANTNLMPLDEIIGLLEMAKESRDFEKIGSLLKTAILELDKHYERSFKTGGLR